MPLSKSSLINSEDRDLLARAADWPHLQSIAEISPDALLLLTQAEGIDFATAVAYDRLCRSQEHGPSIEQLRSLNARGFSSTDASPGTIAVVPGAFHRERSRQTGADGQVLNEEAERLGFAVTIAPTLSFGSLERNSAIVRNWLAQRFADPVVLVSLSKGTAEVKMLLRDVDAERTFRHVTTWVSLSGMWWGSPLVGWLRTHRVRSWLVRQLLRWHGHDFKVIEQLGYGPNEPLAFDVELPDHVELLHVVGFPLERYLCSPLARRGHRRLSPLGPNDAAGLLLADACHLPGTVYPVWGADHYLRPVHEDNRSLVRRILIWLQQRRDCDALLTEGASA